MPSFFRRRPESPIVIGGWREYSLSSVGEAGRGGGNPNAMPLTYYEVFLSLYEVHEGQSGGRSGSSSPTGSLQE